ILSITWVMGSGNRNPPPHGNSKFASSFLRGRLLFRIEVFMKAITLEQFAAMANVSTRTLRRWLKKPSTGVPLPFTPRGTRQLFWEHECKEWLYRTER
ncbi:hypothetical protein, partial [Shigella flexneri]|uniref:hypothetical protein n=1 Tax=Shigella flexneri TaxID=623 RepID=UPI002493115B